MQTLNEAELLTRLRPIVLDAIRSVLAHFPQVKAAYLFGSRARGTHRTGSDTDIALVGNGIDASIQSKIFWALDDYQLLDTFDIVVLDGTLSEAFRQRIEDEGVEVWRRFNDVLVAAL